MRQVVLLCQERDTKIDEHVKPAIPDTGTDVILSFSKVGAGGTIGWFYFHCVLPDDQWVSIKAWADTQVDVKYWEGDKCYADIMTEASISLSPDVYSDAEKVFDYNTEYLGENIRIKTHIAKKVYNETILKKDMHIPHKFLGIEVT